MLELTELAMGMPLPVEQSVRLVTRSWNACSDKFLKITNEAGIPDELAKSALFSTWIKLELGDGGNRAILWASARSKHWKPNNSASFGSKDNPADIAYAYVAEQLAVDGKDPVEAVRKSVSRFVYRMRRENAFIFNPASCHIKFVSGNNILASFGIR